MDIQIDLTNIILETERLILRPFTDSDLADLNEYASVEGVGEMAGWKHHKNIEETKQILDMFIAEKNIFAIVLKDSDKVIGSLGLHLSWANCDDRYRDLKQKEVGYVLSKAYWGSGLVPEAVGAVIKFCFNKLGLEALSVEHFLTNNQSRRVIEKCGFTFVKKDKYYAKNLDLTFDDMKYILLREDFINECKRKQHKLELCCERSCN